MSRQNPTIDRVIAIIEPACVHAGLELVDVRMVMEPGGSTLRVCIDRPWPDDVPVTAVPNERVDLGQIEQMSRELSALLDVEDPITQAYSLEVSSPGIDRPLRTPAHFARFAGAEIKLQLSQPIVESIGNNPGIERRNFRGILNGFADGNILITVDGRDYQLPISNLDNAKIIPDWDAVLAGQSGVIPVANQSSPAGKKVGAVAVKPARTKPAPKAAKPKSR